ncbi:MAG: RdgB/HAM1 family non-canonical purine NTP pyrophosphatase [Syntrophorhabdales bacterium]|jgi:XTP/dITP diphosphohydrolase
MDSVIIIATANRGKFGEIRQCLAGRFSEFFSLSDLKGHVEVVEDRPTYVENAWKKARKIGDRFGMATLADDSGLEVAALDGRPGVFSARYGANDDERVERLLGELRGVPMEGRSAHFKAYLVYYLPDGGQTFIFYGSLRGYIGFERRGKAGFGFDPVFMLPESGRALAELTLEEKNSISHRGRALAAFKKFLAASA